MDFIRQVLARDSAVRDDIIARIESEGFIDVLGRRTTATRARRIIATAENASASLDFADAAAQAVVLFDVRPSLLVRDDRFELPASPVWRDRLIEAESAIRRAIPSVGRVDITDHPHPRIADLPHLGTAWMISESVAVTNRHVARAFGLRVGNEFRFWSDSMSVRIDFRADPGDDGGPDFHVARILDIAEDGDEDIAFLVIDADPSLPRPVVLDDHCEDEFIVTLGYPAWDPQIPPEILHHVLDDAYYAKRLAPGRVVDAGSDRRFRHDASTLKNSSGSVVLSLETGRAVGLQMSGGFNAENHAVTAARLKKRLSALKLAVPVPATNNGQAFEIGTDPVIGLPESPGGYDPEFLGAEFAIPLPGLDSPDALVTPGIGKELKYNHFSIVMHRTRRLAICAACNIDGSRLRRIPRHGGLLLDGRLSTEHQWGEALYRHNPYDPGQLIGRLSPVWGDRVTATKANDDTFFFTNTVPQHGLLNRRLWYGLEDHVLDTADTPDFGMSVFTGCIFDPADPVYRGARIPRAFWKIIAFVEADDRHSSLRASGFLIDQSHLVRDAQQSFAVGAFKTYQLPITEIAGLSGLALATLERADVLNRAGLPGRLPISRLGDIALRPSAIDDRGYDEF